MTRLSPTPAQMNVLDSLDDLIDQAVENYATRETRGAMRGAMRARSWALATNDFSSLLAIAVGAGVHPTFLWGHAHEWVEQQVGTNVAAYLAVAARSHSGDLEPGDAVRMVAAATAFANLRERGADTRMSAAIRHNGPRERPAPPETPAIEPTGARLVFFGGRWQAAGGDTWDAHMAAYAAAEQLNAVQGR